jgi:hypothetical protein
LSPPVTTKTPKPHSVRLRVTDAELRFLQEEAQRQERTISSLLRLALREYVAKVES